MSVKAIIKSFVIILSLTSQSSMAQELSGYEAMKTVYCYTYFNEMLLNPKLVAEKVTLSKEKSDILYPYYRDSIERLMKPARDDMIKSPRTLEERKVNVIEQLMLFDACVAHANELHKRDTK